MRLSQRHRDILVISCLTSLASADYISPLHYAGLQKRQDCPANYFSCADQGAAFAGTCCADGQKCALDQDNQAACCPTSAICTGTIPTTAAPTQSYISNQYFIFPAIPTSFSNSAACSRAASACSRNFDVCTSDLVGEGGGNGVTIVVPGSTTVAPTRPALTTSLPLASASSICGSLSSAACHGLTSTQCGATGSTAGFEIGTENAAPRATGCCGVVGRVIAGVGLGVLGLGI